MFAFLIKKPMESQFDGRQTLESVPNTTSVALQAQVLSQHVPRKSRRRNLKKYKGCCTGDEVSRCMMECGMIADSSLIAYFGNELLRRGFIIDVCGADKVFRSSGLYRFDDDRIQNDIDLQSPNSPQSISSEVNLSLSVQLLIEDSPEMSSFDLDYDIVHQHSLSSFHAAESQETPELAMTPSLATTPSIGLRVDTARSSGLSTKSCTRSRGKSTGNPSLVPMTRSMPMLIDSRSGRKRPSSVYRAHHNRGGSGLMPTMVTKSSNTISVPISSSIALFASTTEHTPEPVACDADSCDVQEAMPSDDDDEMENKHRRARHKSTDFDLPDIHALEDSISEIEFIDEGLHILNIYNSEISDSRFVD